MTRLRFIAETDGFGQVSWVWRFGPDDRIARPVKRTDLDPADVHEAEFHGAPETAIVAWLTGHAEGRRAGADTHP
jgi:hypothetical protein